MAKKVQDKKALVKEKRSRSLFLSVVTDIFVIAVLAGQFLVYDDYYFNMLETKYYYYCICAIGLLGLFAIYGIIRLIVKLVKKEPILKGKKKFREIFSGTDLMVLAFATIVIISTALAPYKWEAFWGNEGRYSGAFLLLIYVGVYFCVTRCYTIKAWHMELFLIAGLIMCFLGISDFWDMDLLHFKENITDAERRSFTSTIGNINTYTSCVAMVMAVAGALFAGGKKLLGNIWHGFVVIVTFAAMIIGTSDNAYLSLAAFFGFMPLYMFRSREGIRRYIVLLTMFFSVAWGISYMETNYADQVVQINSIFQMISQYSGLRQVVERLWILCVVLYALHFALCILRYVTKKNKGQADGTDIGPAVKKDFLCKWLVRLWWCVIILVIAAAIYVLWDVNFAGNVERYGSLKEYLYFDDNWGTHRGYIWRIAIENYKKFPLLQKIFGYGPDTFALVTWFNNYEEMVNIHHVRYDSVHNEFLQYFVTIGPIGLLSYLGILATSIWSVARKRLDNPVVVGAMFAVLCFGVQGIVNIHQPIATPVMWLLMCISVTPAVEKESIFLRIKNWLFRRHKTE